RARGTGQALRAVSGCPPAAPPMAARDNGGRGASWRRGPVGFAVRPFAAAGPRVAPTSVTRETPVVIIRRTAAARNVRLPNPLNPADEGTVLAGVGGGRSNPPTRQVHAAGRVPTRLKDHDRVIITSFCRVPASACGGLARGVGRG